MGRNPLSVTPPSWLDIDAGSYKRLLNHTAVTITNTRQKAWSHVSGEGGHRCHPCSLSAL